MSGSRRSGTKTTAGSDRGSFHDETAPAQQALRPLHPRQPAADARSPAGRHRGDRRSNCRAHIPGTARLADHLPSRIGAPTTAGPPLPEARRSAAYAERTPDSVALPGRRLSRFERCQHPGISGPRRGRAASRRSAAMAPLPPVRRSRAVPAPDGSSPRRGTRSRESRRLDGSGRPVRKGVAARGGGRTQ